MKRTVCLALAALMALPIISCSETPASSIEDPSKETQSGNHDESLTVSVTEEETTGIPEPELPELNYDGADFTILTRGRYSGSFEEMFLISEGLNGELVNDAIFNRNLSIEDEFNIKFNIIEYVDTPTRVRKLVMSDDPSVDVADTQATALATLSVKGYLVDFFDIPHLNLAADYWSENDMNDLQIDGHLYMMSSDLSMERMEETLFLYFNKELFNEYDLESPYTLVDENRWTLDKYLEDISKVSRDLNGDGIYDSNDLYGLLDQPECISYYTASCGIKLTERDEENGLVCTVFSQKTDDVLNKMKACFESPNTITYERIQRGVDYSAYKNYWEWARTLFTNRQYLLLPCGMFLLEYLREMNDDFGVAPMPKYDEAQENYCHRISPYACIFAVPTSCSDLERVGAVMEYGSWISNQLLLPAYYDTTIKQKRFRDEKACEMVEIIRKTARHEIGEVYDLGISAILTNAVTEGDFASKYAKQEEKIKKNIEKLFTSIRELDEMNS